MDDLKYGDPFYIAKQYRRGRVLAFMGAAGASGPEGDYWGPLNRQGRIYFPPLMKDSLQHYLCSTSTELSLPLGKPFDFDLEAAAYDPIIKIRSLANNDRPAAEEDNVKITDLGLAKDIVTADPLLTWKFPGGMKAGAYLFEFSPKASPDLAKKDNRPDLRALAYNFDTSIESNLLRARTDDLLTIAKVEKIETMDEMLRPWQWPRNR